MAREISRAFEACQSYSCASPRCFAALSPGAVKASASSSAVHAARADRKDGAGNRAPMVCRASTGSSARPVPATFGRRNE